MMGQQLSYSRVTAIQAPVSELLTVILPPLLINHPYVKVLIEIEAVALLKFPLWLRHGYQIEQTNERNMGDSKNDTSPVDKATTYIHPHEHMPTAKPPSSHPWHLLRIPSLTSHQKHNLIIYILSWTYNYAIYAVYGIPEGGWELIFYCLSMMWATGWTAVALTWGLYNMWRGGGMEMEMEERGVQDEGWDDKKGREKDRSMLRA
ncbi:hypothetical protein P154DRAFT_271836 [Amniculicola lignicola CBS 123094]|uniref:Uncharacterized protein n=1 Tax=Amniculicola lignicola CBS 123094 TaxID=1392246 RepID=A0A6A5W7N2_9PLEO|nr:hypothetical protein P154DRAFT_271836 [Amniculicola lignicola CBS 123094]